MFELERSNAVRTLNGHREIHGSDVRSIRRDEFGHSKPAHFV
jgi:hypothetical protein